jgi:hypothetical protein
MPHAPQFVALVCVSTQVPLQNVSPDAHPLHLPDAHVTPLVHAAPHAPQFWLSVCKLTQPDPQSV